MTRTDDKIDGLIRPPRVIFEGFDWSQTQKLAPTGAAHLANVLSERLRPTSRQSAE